MKILITGVAGFIGSHCAERLHEMGHYVIGIDNFSNYYSVNLKRQNAKALSKLGIHIIERDLSLVHLENSLPLDIDYIFHFAAQPGISKTSSFKDYLTNNIEATQNLLEFATDFNNTTLFVNIGTSSIYGLDATCDEAAPPMPASNYGVTKLAAEQLVLSKSRLGSLNACSLRLYSVFGSRERPDKMFTKLISLGLDENSNALFFFKKGDDKVITKCIDLNEIKNCKIIDIRKAPKNKESRFKEIEKLELSFSPIGKDKRDIVLKFYDYNESMSLNGELELTKKWLEIINGRLMPNKTKELISA